MQEELRLKCMVVQFCMMYFHFFFVASKIPEAWFAHSDTCTNYLAGETKI